MLHFIYGRTGTGKSGYIYSLAQSSAEKKHTFILVPDREAVSAEHDCAGLPGTGNIDVVTFGRLCNFIFRKNGGICGNYIGAGAKKIIMYNVLRDLTPKLQRFGEIRKGDTSTVEKLLSARSELYRNAISPEALEKASSALSARSRISEKLSDLFLIFSSFDAEVGKKWSEPDGALSKACEVCGDYFRGTDVYIDSFFTFTKEQYRMLSLIFSSCEEIYITLAYLPDEDRGQAAFISLSETDERLHRTAKNSKIKLAEPLYFRRSRRYANDELAFLAENMFSGRDYSAKYTREPSHIAIMSCSGAYAEADAVASDIARRVRDGARYRDIAVIMRETADYEGIIDASLEKYGIPYFLSRRADIDERPLVKFIYSSYAIALRGFPSDEIISYIKTDYAGIAAEECDLLENYMIKWNISGRKFYSEEQWRASPRGYESRRRAEEPDELVALSDIRERVKKPLLRFAGAIKSCRTVRDHANLLYDFLTYMKIPEKIRSDAESSAAQGDNAGAEELLQLWRVLCRCLDEIVGSAGARECDGTDFLQFVKLAFSETDIGMIPTSVDEVLVGGAAKIRPLSAKTVYIIGGSDGIFPKKPDEGGIFSEYEKSLLEKAGIELSSRLEKNMSDEMFYFFSSACSPSEELFITYSEYDASGGERGKSVAVKRVCALFPELKIKRFESLGISGLLYAPEPAFEYSLSAKDAAASALRDYFSSRPEYSERVGYAGKAVSQKICRLEPEFAEEMFGGRLDTSYSRIESYVKCRFQYFCRYELDLADNTRAGFSDADIGSFMHAALEASVRYAAKPDATREEIADSVEKAAEEFMEKISGSTRSQRAPRLLRLTDYLCRCAEKLALSMRQAFAQSRFKPVDFELKIGDGAGKIAPVKLEKDDIRVKLSGSIDRVDAYERGDGKIYLRVVDYKKHAKSFDFDRLALGLDLQMPLYLFSLWENGKAYYGKETVPAGVLYVETNPNPADGELGEKPSETKQAVSGFVLKDGEDGLDIARAMEPSLEGKYIPVKAGGAAKKNIIGEEELKKLKTEVSQTVLKFAGELKNGIADASPLYSGGVEPCKYCRMSAVCRAKRRKDE